MKKLKHLIEYWGFVLLTRILRLLTIDQAAQTMAKLAKIIGPHLAVSNVARQNLHLAFGDGIDTRWIIQELWDNYGRYIGEFPFVNDLDQDFAQQRIHIHNLALLNQFKAQKQPFIIFLAHQANWDIIINQITRLYPEFAIIYRSANNPYVDQAILRARSKNPDLTLIPKGISGAKHLIKAIKARKALALLVDQKMNDGIEVPFFGQPAMTAPAIARLSLQYNLPIIPVQQVRRPGKTAFDIYIHPPLEYKVTGDMSEDCYVIMQQINAILEEWIKAHPGQWFWFHNRWKR